MSGEPSESRDGLKTCPGHLQKCAIVTHWQVSLQPECGLVFEPRLVSAATVTRSRCHDVCVHRHSVGSPVSVFGVTPAPSLHGYSEAVVVVTKRCWDDGYTTRGWFRVKLITVLRLHRDSTTFKFRSSCSSCCSEPARRGLGVPV